MSEADTYLDRFGARAGAERSGIRQLLLAASLILPLCFITTRALPSVAGVPERPVTQVVHEAASTYNRRVFVVDEDGYRAMRFGSLDRVDQSRIRPGHPGQLPMPYLRSAAAGLAVPRKLDRALVIGLGGGAFPAFLRPVLPAVSVDAVEIDPVVARIARDYFGLVEDEGLRIHVIDAVEHVKQPLEPYDYILLDAYDADDLPAALTANTFLERVHSRLDTGGVAVINIAISSEFRTRALIRKFSAFFDYCLRMKSTPSRNDVLLLSDTPLPTRANLQVRAARFDAGGEPGFTTGDHIAAATACL